MRLIVTAAAPEVTTVAPTGETMPMSLARIDRTGPTTVGDVGVEERRQPGAAALDELLDHEVGGVEALLRGARGAVVDLDDHHRVVLRRRLRHR